MRHSTRAPGEAATLSPHRQRQLPPPNRLFAQIKRILATNKLTTITREAIETAREGLVIGQPPPPTSAVRTPP
jgi:hypothetical protein